MRRITQQPARSQQKQVELTSALQPHQIEYSPWMYRKRPTRPTRNACPPGVRRISSLFGALIHRAGTRAMHSDSKNIKSEMPHTMPCVCSRHTYHSNQRVLASGITLQVCDERSTTRFKQLHEPYTLRSSTIAVANRPHRQSRSCETAPARAASSCRRLRGWSPAQERARATPTRCVWKRNTRTTTPAVAAVVRSACLRSEIGCVC